MNRSFPLVERLTGSFARPNRFNPSENLFFIEDQPIEPVLPIDHLVKSSPLFARFFDRTRWLQQGEKGLQRFHLLTLIPIIAVFILATVFHYFQMGNLPYTYRYFLIAQGMESASLLLMLLSVPGALLVDLICVAAALRQYQRTSSDDIILLSRLSSRGIIISHYAAIRLRAWRWMTLIFMMRVFAVVAYIIVTFILLPMAQGSIQLGSAVGGLSPLNRVIHIGIATCLSVAFVMEARWRLNGVAARALSVAVSRETSIPKEFVGLFNLARLWIRQALSLSVMMFVFTSATVVMVGLLNNFEHERTLGAMFGTGFTAITALALLYLVRQHYLAITHNELRRAERLAFKLEPDA